MATYSDDAKLIAASNIAVAKAILQTGSMMKDATAAEHAISTLEWRSSRLPSQNRKPNAMQIAPRRDQRPSAAPSRLRAAWGFGRTVSPWRPTTKKGPLRSERDLFEESER